MTLRAAALAFLAILTWSTTSNAQFVSAAWETQASRGWVRKSLKE
jgi:hypothetical protein